MALARTDQYHPEPEKTHRFHHNKKPKNYHNVPKQYNYVRSYENMHNLETNSNNNSSENEESGNQYNQKESFSEAEPYDEAMEKEETLRKNENPWKIDVHLENEEKTDVETTSESELEAYVSTKPVVYSQYGNDKPKKTRGKGYYSSHIHGQKSRGPKKHYGDNPAPYQMSYETEV